MAEFTVTHTDGLAFLDPSGDSHAGLDLPRFDQDALLLATAATRTLDRLLADLVLLRDTVAALRTEGGLIERTATDALGLLDVAIRDVQRLRVDGLLVTDPPMTGRGLTPQGDALLMGDPGPRRELLKAVLLSLYLRDAVTTETEAAAAILRSVTDTLLLVDARLSALDRLVREPLLVTDDELKEAFHDLTVADGLFLADTRVSTLERRVLAALLLLDTVQADQETPPVGGVHTRTLTDTLLVAAAVLRDVALVRAEGLLLGDADVRALTRALADRLLLAPAEPAREVGRTAMDRLLVAEALTRVRDLLAREGIVLGEAAVAQYLAVVVATLRGIAARAVDLLGVRLAGRDLLGLAVAGADLLGVQVAAHASAEG